MNTWRIVRSFESVAAGGSDQPYATPVPWSTSERITPGPIRFHFIAPAAGSATITIYDFANNNVVEIVNDLSLDAGVQYDDTHTWDGRNEKGDFVAVGVYFFIIEFGDGSAQDGKLIVLP